MLEASPTTEQTCPLLPLAPTLRWVPFLLGHCPPCQPLLPAGPERPVSTPASLPHRARVAPRVPSHRSQGQERCSCQDFCEERTLLWARSHHPATLTQSECAAHGFQTACDFWRKLWQVTSLPGLPPPAPPNCQERLSHSLCVSFHGATLQSGSLSPQPSLDRAAVGHPLHNLLRHSEHKPSVHVLCPNPPGWTPSRTLLPG